MNFGYLFVITSLVIAAFSQILLKSAANREYSSFIKQYLNIRVISGYALMFISLFLTMMGYRYLEYRIVPLLESTGFIFVMILSRIFFKEPVTLKKVLGICVIIGGIVIYYL